MNTAILPTLLGSLLAMAPIVDSTVRFNSELTRPALTATSLVVHEWGTFTALQGSNGIPQNGMQHEEEGLPDFVHSRDPMNEIGQLPGARRCPGFCKGFEPGTIYNSSRDVDHMIVTQKMETPVLYFYSQNEVKDAKVDIGFPQGIISQYYPAPQTFLPALDHVLNLSGGHVEFQFDIANQDAELAIPEVSSESVYAPSRNVSSNFIQTKTNETEKLIFYRGLGNFSTNVSITSDQAGIQIKNLSNTAPVPAGILLYSDGGFSGGFLTVQEIPALQSVKFSYAQIEDMVNETSPFLVPHVSQALASQLEQSGLFHDEAVAMVNTWKKSYFKNRGLRFLHILPRAETEALLPLTMSPQPTELVRTLVGRIEIMTYQEEQNLISQIVKDGETFQVDGLGHLAEAKLRRIQQLVPAGFKTDIQKLIETSVNQ